MIWQQGCVVTKCEPTTLLLTTSNESKQIQTTFRTMFHNGVWVYNWIQRNLDAYERELCLRDCSCRKIRSFRRIVGTDFLPPLW